MKYSVEDKQVFKLHKRYISDYVSVVIFLLCVYLSIFMISFSFCFTSSYVYGESMKPTINNYADYEHNRDVVYIDKNASYTYGDIIVIKKNDIEIIKRVIALPGDTVDIKNVGGEYVVVRNDQVLQEDYIRLVPGSADYNGMAKEYALFQNYKENHKNDEDLFVDKDNYAQSAIKVHDGQVFVLGDNRHNSDDSSTEGSFAMSDVVGKVEIIVRAGKSSLVALLNYFYNPFK